MQGFILKRLSVYGGYTKLIDSFSGSSYANATHYPTVLQVVKELNPSMTATHINGVSDSTYLKKNIRYPFQLALDDDLISEITKSVAASSSNKTFVTELNELFSRPEKFDNSDPEVHFKIFSTKLDLYALMILKTVFYLSSSEIHSLRTLCTRKFSDMELFKEIFLFIKAKSRDIQKRRSTALRLLVPAGGTKFSRSVGYVPIVVNPFTALPSESAYDLLFNEADLLATEFSFMLFLIAGRKVMKLQKRMLLPVMRELPDYPDLSKSELSVLEERSEIISWLTDQLDSIKSFSAQANTEPQAMIQKYQARVNKSSRDAKLSSDVIHAFYDAAQDANDFKKFLKHYQECPPIQFFTNAGAPVFSSKVRGIEAKMFLVNEARGKFSEASINYRSADGAYHFLQAMLDVCSKINPSVNATNFLSLLRIGRTRTAGKDCYVICEVPGGDNIVVATVDDVSPSRSAYGLPYYLNAILGAFTAFPYASKRVLPGYHFGRWESIFLQLVERIHSGFNGTSFSMNRLQKLWSSPSNFRFTSDISQFDLNCLVNSSLNLAETISDYLKYGSFFKEIYKVTRNLNIVFRANFGGDDDTTPSAICLDVDPSMMPSGCFTTPQENTNGIVEGLGHGLGYGTVKSEFNNIVSISNGPFRELIHIVHNRDKSAMVKLITALTYSANVKTFSSGDDLSRSALSLEALIADAKLVKKGFDKINLEASPTLSFNFLKKDTSNGNWTGHTFRACFQNTFFPEKETKSLTIAVVGYLARIERAGLFVSSDVFDPLRLDVGNEKGRLFVFNMNYSRAFMCDELLKRGFTFVKDTIVGNNKDVIRFTELVLAGNSLILDGKISPGYYEWANCQGHSLALIKIGEELNSIKLKYERLIAEEMGMVNVKELLERMISTGTIGPDEERLLNLLRSRFSPSGEVLLQALGIEEDDIDELLNTSGLLALQFNQVMGIPAYLSELR